MSDFQIQAGQRQRLLAGQYSPLTFKGVLDPDNARERLPHGCKPGARYVLAWKAASVTVVSEDPVMVSRTPRHPVWYLTVTAVEGGPRKPRELKDRPWVVRFNVTDIRDSDVFLRPGGGDSSVDVLRAGAKPDPEWLEAHSKMIASFWVRRRLERHVEERRERGRERSRARRKRAA